MMYARASCMCLYVVAHVRYEYVLPLILFTYIPTFYSTIFGYMIHARSALAGTKRRLVAIMDRNRISQTHYATLCRVPMIHMHVATRFLIVQGPLDKSTVSSEVIPGKILETTLMVDFITLFLSQECQLFGVMTPFQIGVSTCHIRSTTAFCVRSTEISTQLHLYLL